MRIALIETTPKAKVYPLPLLKLGAWRKSEGDECTLFRDTLPKAGEFDAIWLTTCFTFDIPHSLGMAIEAKKRAPEVRVGGVAATLLPKHFEKHGLDVHCGLVPEAETAAPDYSLLGTTPEYSIAHTSRGCSRRCGFCMVSTLEPEFQNRARWADDLHPDTKAIQFFDNNWFAKDKADLFADIDTLHRLVKEDTIRTIDFNQGLDCRLLTEEIANALKGLPIRPVRFAFDGMQEDGHYQRGVEMMVERGFVHGDAFATYVLYNFRDTPEDLWYRLRESVRLSHELGATIPGGDLRVRSFPMKYQPIMKIGSRGYTGPHWSKEMLSGFNNMVGSHSAAAGTVSCTGMCDRRSKLEEFAYWFGETAEEFVRLLRYPRLRELLKRKKGNLRQLRVRKKQMDKQESERLINSRPGDGLADQEQLTVPEVPND